MDGTIKNLQKDSNKLKKTIHQIQIDDFVLVSMLQVPELLRIKSLVPPNSNRYMHPIPENLKNVFSIISCNALFHFKVCISHLELNNLTKTYDTFRLIFQAQCPQLPLKNQD